MSTYCEVSIIPNIRQFIQAKTYEQIICNLMNESSIVFPNEYQWVPEQAHGECDFLDKTDGKKYDAKLLFSNIQCQLVSKGVERLLDWVVSIRQEISEASQIVLKKNWTDIQNTTLYKEMLERLQSVADDEAAILFIPFPIVPESEHSVFLQFASDIVSITYAAIVQKYPEKYTHKRTFIIYPSVGDQKIVLRDLTSYRKEYLPIKHLLPYVTYTLKEHPETSAGYILYTNRNPHDEA